MSVIKRQEINKNKAIRSYLLSHLAARRRNPFFPANLRLPSERVEERVVGHLAQHTKVIPLPSRGTRTPLDSTTDVDNRTAVLSGYSKGEKNVAKIKRPRQMWSNRCIMLLIWPSAKRGKMHSNSFVSALQRDHTRPFFYTRLISDDQCGVKQVLYNLTNKRN